MLHSGGQLVQFGLDFLHCGGFALQLHLIAGQRVAVLINALLQERQIFLALLLLGKNSLGLLAAGSQQVVHGAGALPDLLHRRSGGGGLHLGVRQLQGQVAELAVQFRSLFCIAVAGVQQCLALAGDLLQLAALVRSGSIVIPNGLAQPRQPFL